MCVCVFVCMYACSFLRSFVGTLLQTLVAHSLFCNSSSRIFVSSSGTFGAEFLTTSTPLAVDVQDQRSELGGSALSPPSLISLHVCNSVFVSVYVAVDIFTLQLHTTLAFAKPTETKELSRVRQISEDFVWPNDQTVLLAVDQVVDGHCEMVEVERREWQTILVRDTSHYTRVRCAKKSSATREKILRVARDRCARCGVQFTPPVAYKGIAIACQRNSLKKKKHCGSFDNANEK